MQGLCFEVSDGRDSMLIWDKLPSNVRRLFQEARINVCCACAALIVADITEDAPKKPLSKPGSK